MVNRSGLDEVLAHVAGDYVCQSDWMATEKTVRWWPAIAHAVTYAACFLPVTRNWRALAVIASTHAVIDHTRPVRHLAWAKNQVAPAGHRPSHNATGYGDDKPMWLVGWLNIITDNWIHLIINRWALRRWSS